MPFGTIINSFVRGYQGHAQKIFGDLRGSFSVELRSTNLARQSMRRRNTIRNLSIETNRKNRENSTDTTTFNDTPVLQCSKKKKIGRLNQEFKP